jgi:hypothetical protein
MLGVVAQEGVGEVEHLDHSRVGDPVQSRAVLAACLNEPAPP